MVMNKQKLGYTLIELLTVLIIVGLLVSIGLPALMGNKAQQNVVQGTNRFLAEMNYARSQAQSSGSNVYVVFAQQSDGTQYELPYIDNNGDGVSDVTMATSVGGSQNGVNLCAPPVNPGVSRVADKFYIIEERPRIFQVPSLEDLQMALVQDSLAVKKLYTPLQCRPDLYNRYLSTGLTPNEACLKILDYLGKRSSRNYTYNDLYNDVMLASEQGFTGNGFTAQGYRVPAEPIYPKAPMFISGDTYTSGSAFNNNQSSPLIWYPTNLGDVSGGTLTYSSYNNARNKPRNYQNLTSYTSEENQDQKMFCVMDYYSLAGMKGPYKLTNGTILDPTTFAPARPVSVTPPSINPPTGWPSSMLDNFSDRYWPYNQQEDHPRLSDTVLDYILVKEVKLPEHAYFFNPWRCRMIISRRSAGPSSGPSSFTYEDFQFLQFATVWRPDGTGSIRQWTFQPQSFPMGSDAVSKGLAYRGQVHGQWVDRAITPGLRNLNYFIVNDQAVAVGPSDNQTATFEGKYNNTFDLVARVDLNSRASEMDANARQIVLWAVNGKSSVYEYTPNDVGQKFVIYGNPSTAPAPVATNAPNGLGPARWNDIDLDTPIALGGDTVLRARVAAYRQNFLVPGINIGDAW